MEEENKCMAVTGSGNSCNNTAIYPEDNPVVCHLKSHQEQMETLPDIEETEELEKELKQNQQPPLKEDVDRRYITETMYVI